MDGWMVKLESLPLGNVIDFSHVSALLNENSCFDRSFCETKLQMIARTQTLKKKKKKKKKNNKNRPGGLNCDDSIN